MSLKPGTTVLVKDPASQMNGARAEVVGPSKTFPAEYTVVKVGDYSEAVSTRRLEVVR